MKARGWAKKRLIAVLFYGYPKQRKEKICYHAGIAPHQPDRGIQNWESVEDPKGECCGVFEVLVKAGE